MTNSYQKILNQIEKLSREGIFGKVALASAEEYEDMPYDISRLSKFIRELSLEIFSIDSDETQIVSIFWQMLLVVYRDSKKNDPNVSLAYLNSFVKDYPGTSQTAMTYRLNSLTHAIFAFNSVADSKEMLLMWQQSAKLFLEYSEFLNGLLGYLIIAWKCAQNKPINLNVFKSTYAQKAHQFEQLTNGDDGAFYLFHRIIIPSLRNAIAHGQYWLDYEERRVRYVDGKDKMEKELPLDEFIVTCMIGSKLPKSYIAALSTIIIWEFGTEVQKMSLPQNLIKLLAN